MIPNIAIKIKPSTLEGVLFLLRQEPFKNPIHLKPELRAMASILIPLSRKLNHKIQLWWRRDNASKSYQLTFEYHEAYALYAYIHGMIDKLPYGSERNSCNIVHDLLNQELQ